MTVQLTTRFQLTEQTAPDKYANELNKSSVSNYISVINVLAIFVQKFYALAWVVIEVDPNWFIFCTCTILYFENLHLLKIYDPVKFLLA